MPMTAKKRKWRYRHTPWPFYFGTEDLLMLFVNIKQCTIIVILRIDYYDKITKREINTRNLYSILDKISNQRTLCDTQ